MYINDLFKVLREHKDIWWFLSKQDLNSQFRRSKLGSLWLVINQLSFAFGAGLIWAVVFGIDPIEFIPFIATGFAVWGFIAACFVDGSAALNISQGYIKQVNLPLPIYCARIVVSNIVRLSIGLTVAMSVVGLFGDFGFYNLFTLIPGVVLVLFCGFFISMTFSYLGAIYKDIGHALSNVFQLLFVLTPVIYPPEMLIKKGLWFAVYFNPLSSFIQVIRVPLVDGTFASAIDYIVLSVTLIVFVILSYKVSKKFENKVAYYV
jgi:ABC-type polysaccharide/polyol phosphate export permease